MLDHAPGSPSAASVTHTRAPSSSAKHHRVCRKKQKQRARRRKQRREEMELQKAPASDTPVDGETCADHAGADAPVAVILPSAEPSKTQLSFTKIDDVHGLYDIVTHADVQEYGEDMGTDTFAETHHTDKTEGDGEACVIC